MAGLPVSISSIAMRTVYVPGARFSGTYSDRSTTASPGSHYFSFAGTRITALSLDDFNSMASWYSR